MLDFLEHACYSTINLTEFKPLEESMSLGPRLVIPGAILGSLLLAAVLYLVTAGLSYPTAALAAEEVGEPTPAAAPAGEVIAVDQEADGALEAEVDPDISQVNCEVSDEFPVDILQWCGIITHYSNKRGFPPDLIAALILQESGGNPVAYSHSGATGLMQVMPRDGLSASFMCINGPCFANRPTIAELEDPQFNVSYGTKMLAGLVQKRGDIRSALKSYGPMDVGYSYADTVLALYERFGK
jgi:hypothetical protein